MLFIYFQIYIYIFPGILFTSAAILEELFLLMYQHNLLEKAPFSPKKQNISKMEIIHSRCSIRS